VAWLVTTPAMTYAARRQDPALAAPVAVYATALATMLATASRLDPALEAGARRTVQAGAALFLVSDTLLGLRQFVVRGDVPLLEAAAMVTYTVGQGLIAAGVRRL